MLQKCVMTNREVDCFHKDTNPELTGCLGYRIPYMVTKWSNPSNMLG
jgi:hypothetical protein